MGLLLCQSQASWSTAATSTVWRSSVFARLLLALTFPAALCGVPRPHRLPFPGLHDGALPLTPLCLPTIPGLASVQVALVCV
jgi:hypothetical protein